MTLKASDLVGPEHQFVAARLNPNRCSECGLVESSSVHYMIRFDENHADVFYLDDYNRMFDMDIEPPLNPEPSGPCSCLQHKTQNCSECFSNPPKAYIAFPAGMNAPNPSFGPTDIDGSSLPSPGQHRQQLSRDSRISRELSECTTVKKQYEELKDKLTDIIVDYVISENAKDILKT